MNISDKVTIGVKQTEPAPVKRECSQIDFVQLRDGTVGLVLWDITSPSGKMFFRSFKAEIRCIRYVGLDEIRYRLSLVAAEFEILD